MNFSDFFRRRPLGRSGRNRPMFCEAPTWDSCFTLTKRLDSHSRQHLDKLVQDAIGIAVIARSKASPEAPTNALEHTLPTHVLPPLLRTVVPVTVALYGETPSVCAFHNHVDPVPDAPNLSLNPVSAL